MSTNFKKVEENFKCEKCGFEVVGDGYTDHCPKCLWSKHVDVNPGDRAEECKGMMEPVDVIFDHGQYALVNRCQKCGYEKKNKMDENDDFDKAIEIAKKNSRRYMDM